MSTQSVLLYNFQVLGDMSEDKIVKEIEEYKEDEERFIIDNYFQHQIEGTYVFVFFSKEYIFDYETNDFKTIDVSKSIAIQFHINMITNTLDIWSNKRNAQKLLTAFTMLYNNNLILEPYEISFEKSINYLKDMSDIKISTVKVEDISFDNNIIASCSFNLLSHSEPFSVLEKYLKKISKLTFILNSNNFENAENTNEDISISIYQSGAFVVYKNRKEISSTILNKIEKLLETSRRK